MKDFAGPAGRLTVGIGIGASAIVVPVYLAEIAPAKQRGAVVQVYELMLCCGVLLSLIVGWALQGERSATNQRRLRNSRKWNVLKLDCFEYYFQKYSKVLMLTAASHRCIVVHIRLLRSCLFLCARNIKAAKFDHEHQG